MAENVRSFSRKSARAPPYFWSMHRMRGYRTTNASHRPIPPRRNLLGLGAAALIPEMLEEQGISEEAAFVRTWFSRRSLAQPEPVVPIAWLGRLFKSAVAATAQAEFGLLVGLRAGSRPMDWGQGPMPNDTQVSTALMRIISRPASFPNAFLTLSVSGDTSTIGCIALPRTLIARDQLADCAIGFAAGALRVLCGPRWHPRGFHFAHGPPPDPSRLTALLQAPISYDANVTAMEFASSWLDGDYASPPVHASNDANEWRLNRDLVGEVRAVLTSWNAVDRPTAPAVASVLGLRPRTLNRLLGKTGTSFNRMLGDTRYEVAQRMLRDRAAPIVSIAWSLGYADASAFSRAFRRWSGITPTEWRQAADSGTLRASPDDGMA
jgi:AraC-like DNA-binding protein